MRPKTDVSANAGELEMFQIATEKKVYCLDMCHRKV